MAMRRRYAALATAGAGLLVAAPLAAVAAAKPPALTIAVSSLKILDDDTRKVTFTTGSKQKLKSYSWTFGDPSKGAQNRSTAAQPVHVFAAHKTYVVTLVATTPQGAHLNAALRLKL